MTTPQDLDFNQTEETTVPSTFFPLHETFTSYPSSDRPLKGVEKVPQGQLSGSTQAKSTDVSSSQSTFNKKDDIMPIMENQQHYDIQAPGPIDSELSTSISKQLASQKEASISPKKGLKTGKKKEAKAQKNAPQKKKNPSFIKSKGQNSSSGKKKTPQSPYKNVYKAIFCEILSYIQFFCSLELGRHSKIFKEAMGSQEKWTEDIQMEPLFTDAMDYELDKSGFIGFVESNKVELMDVLEDKRFVKFMPLYDMIQESDGLINEEDCRIYYDERKGRSLKNLQGEEKILTWLLIVGFSLVFLPAEATAHLLPVQKDTVALLHWIISSRTQAKSKCMLLDADHREHIREFLETTFNDLLKSAMSQFPARHGWLTKVHDLVNERELPATTNVVKGDPDMLKEAAYAYVLSDVQGAGGSTAADSRPHSPSEGPGHETVDPEELSRRQTAFLGRLKEITYDKNFLDQRLIQESKLVFSYDDEIVTNQKNLESPEEPFYARMHAFEKEVDRAWSKSGNKSLEIGDLDQNELRSAWKLQRDLNIKRVNFLCGGYNIESRKKVKKM